MLGHQGTTCLKAIPRKVMLEKRIKYQHVTKSMYYKTSTCLLEVPANTSCYCICIDRLALAPRTTPYSPASAPQVQRGSVLATMRHHYHQCRCSEYRYKNDMSAAAYSTSFVDKDQRDACLAPAAASTVHSLYTSSLFLVVCISFSIRPPFSLTSFQPNPKLAAVAKTASPARK